MTYQRVHQSSSWNPSARKKTSQFASRPFTDQAQLSGLQIQTEDFWAETLARASHCGHNLARISLHKAHNIGMPENLQAGIETLSGLSLEDVKIHYNSSKPARLQALAYTQGSDIHLGPGQEQYLPHEAWHVVQQKQGRVAPAIQRQGVHINADAELEKEAEVMGHKALQPQAQRFPTSAPRVPCLLEHTHDAPGPHMTSSTAAGMRVAQLFPNQQTARRRAQDFNAEMTAAEQLMAQLNTHLRTFSATPTRQHHAQVIAWMQSNHQQLVGHHNAMAAVMQEYEQAQPSERQTFINEYLGQLPGNFGQGAFETPSSQGTIGGFAAPYSNQNAFTMFDTLVNQTQMQQGNTDTIYKWRFLAFALQGMKNAVGMNQIASLVNLMGQRTMKVEKQGPINLSAGLESAQEALGTRTDIYNAPADQLLATQAGGNVLTYLQNRFQQGYPRTANQQAANIGNLQVNMDRDDLLLPVFGGVRGAEAELYAPQKHTTVHHEIGHVINFLEGTAGFGRAVPPGMKALGDQEEMYNIYGAPRSDFRYHASLGHPSRFTHKLMRLNMQDDYQGMLDMLKDTYHNSNDLNSMQQKVFAVVQDIAMNAQWFWQAKGFNAKPSGVGDIRNALGQQGLNHQHILQNVQANAQSALQQASSRRKPATTRFYTILSTMNPTDKNNLIDTLMALKTFSF